MADPVEDVSEDRFDELVGTEGALLVDFWAEWCGPCRSMAPVLDALAAERDDLRVVKVNVDEQPGLARRFEVMSLPTFVLFVDGSPRWRAVGARSGSSLRAELGDYLP